MAIQLTICLINLVIIYFLPEIAYESYGVGALWFNLVYKYCYNNSLRPIKVCCFGCKINKKLYPLLLWTVLCVLQFKLRHDCLIGIIIAAQECLVCPRWTLWSVSLFRTL